MAKEREMLELRRVVSAIPNGRLHMRSVKELADCGTAYCAYGWAAIDPWFIKNTRIWDTVRLTFYDGSMDFHGAAEIFGITRGDARALFHASASIFDDPHMVTKDQVLENIDRLLAGQPAIPYPRF